jgi:hypothetical protein
MPSIVPYPTRIKAAAVLAEIPGFTVTEICPADVDPAFASREFDPLAAALVSQNGNPMLRVLAGQVKNGSGEAFVQLRSARSSATCRAQRCDDTPKGT